MWLAFTPRDSLFIRDGRAFDAGADNMAHAVWPSPSTVAGAVGAVFGREPCEVRGPVLACRSRKGKWVPYFAPRRTSSGWRTARTCCGCLPGTCRRTRSPTCRPHLPCWTPPSRSDRSNPWAAGCPGRISPVSGG
ncbi:type III-B CRISPR module-associated Cmr3 family protein [Streptomyces sp. INA 01156]